VPWVPFGDHVHAWVVSRRYAPIIGHPHVMISKAQLWQLITSTSTACFPFVQELKHLPTRSLNSAYCNTLLIAFHFSFPRLDLVIWNWVRYSIGNQPILCQRRLWHAYLLLSNWYDVAMHTNSNHWAGSLQATNLQPMPMIPQTLHA